MLWVERTGSVMATEGNGVGGDGSKRGSIVNCFFIVLFCFVFQECSLSTCITFVLRSELVMTCVH